MKLQARIARNKIVFRQAQKRADQKLRYLIRELDENSENLSVIIFNIFAIKVKLFDNNSLAFLAPFIFVNKTIVIKFGNF